MRILYALHAYKPAYRIGGPVLSVSSAAEMLVRKGHEVTVFTTTSNLDQELDDARMREVQKHLENCSACLPHADFGQRFLNALNGARQRHLTPPAVRSQVMAALAADGFRQD